MPPAVWAVRAKEPEAAVVRIHYMRKTLAALLFALSAAPAFAAIQDDAGAAFERDAAAIPAALRRNPLDLPTIPVSHQEISEEMDSPSREVWFSWAPTAEHPHPDARGVFHVFDSPETRSEPLVLLLPMTGDPNHGVIRGFCRYMYRNGFRCAYMERILPDAEDLPATLDGLFTLPGLPPYSAETARHGLDALEEMGILRPGEKVGVGGISMGAIDAALLAATDKRVGAVVMLLGGGDVPKILANIHGPGVREFAQKREEQMKKNHWDLDEFKRQMAEKTWTGDPLVYFTDPELRLNKELRADHFLMINVKGDQAIPNECTSELVDALSRLDGTRPDNRMLHLPYLPKGYRHIGVILRLHYARSRMLQHFERFLADNH